MGKVELLHAAGGNGKQCSHFEKVSQFLKKLNIELLYDPAVPFLAIYPRKLKIHIHAKAYTQTFMAVLFIIARR